VRDDIKLLAHDGEGHLLRHAQRDVVHTAPHLPKTEQACFQCGPGRPVLPRMPKLPRNPPTVTM
jgi:hypothetical protein